MADGKTGAQSPASEGADARATDAHVGQRLRQRRWMLGMTQLQVGNRVGIKFQQVQKYETGQNRISASRLWDLAKALDVPVGYFFEGLPEAPAGSAPLAEAEGDAAACGDPMADRESIELIRSYYAIAEEPRRRLFELAKAMSEAERMRHTDETEDAPAADEASAETAPFLNGRPVEKGGKSREVRLKAG